MFDAQSPRKAGRGEEHHVVVVVVVGGGGGGYLTSQQSAMCIAGTGLL